MYDDAYMRSMLEMFGDDLVGGIGVKPGYKAVMNLVWLKMVSKSYQGNGKS